MSYPTVTPEEVHPSHDVREEGYLITDPYCQHCRYGAVENGPELREPCLGPRVYRLPTSALRKQRLAEAYGMGDVLVGVLITGTYPNTPAI